jgi:hypothetical protein
MFQYLNHDSSWPKFRMMGLEIEPATGAMTLRRLPGAPRLVAALPGERRESVSAAGICSAADGLLFVTAPDS